MEGLTSPNWPFILQTPQGPLDKLQDPQLLGQTRNIFWLVGRLGTALV